jgi:hypothetical protein
MEKRSGQRFFVTLTAYGVLILGAGYCLGAIHDVFIYSTLAGLHLSVPAWYFPLSGFAWGGIWLALGIGLGLGKEWSRRAALAAIPIQCLAWLADERLLSRSAIALQSFGFEAGLRLILAAIGIAILIGVGPLEDPGTKPAANEPIAPMEKTTAHVDR